MTKTFAEMEQVLKQLEGGLLHPAEAILALQCDEVQIAALRQMTALPIAALSCVRMQHFDESVERARETKE